MPHASSPSASRPAAAASVPAHQPALFSALPLQLDATAQVKTRRRGAGRRKEADAPQTTWTPAPLLGETTPPAKPVKRHLRPQLPPKPLGPFSDGELSELIGKLDDRQLAHLAQEAARTVRRRLEYSAQGAQAETEDEGLLFDEETPLMRAGRRMLSELAGPELLAAAGGRTATGSLEGGSNGTGKGRSRSTASGSRRGKRVAAAA